MIPRRLLLPATLAVAGLLVWTVRDRGGALRLTSLLPHHPARRRLRVPYPIEESRLYACRRRRLGAHLTRRRDGRLAVLALPLHGSHRTSVYPRRREQPRARLRAPSPPRRRALGAMP